MSYDIQATIAAIASPPGGALRGVVRLSGPDAVACVGRCFQPSAPIDMRRIRRPRAIAGSLCVAGVTAPLPCEVYLWPGTRSYTRQPVAELHTIGSPPLLEAVVGTVCAAEARPAQPGEFTLRAFLGGRIDLTEAEAVLAVIDATDSERLGTALAQLAGGMGRPIAALRDELLQLLAHLEAGLDFVDEDIQFLSADELRRRLAATAETLAGLVQQVADRGAASSAARVVLTGQPNVGKSSLLNALVGRAAALTSPEPGTTRDFVSARIDLGGLVCELIDTAGLSDNRPPEGPERAAPAMARAERDRALLELLCIDAGRPLCRWEHDQLEQTAAAARIVVLTKTDLPRAAELSVPAIETSSLTRQGIALLRRRLRETIPALQHRLDQAAGGGFVAATAIRCRENLHHAATAIARARQIVKEDAGDELVAAELREALLELGRVVGVVYTDDVLDCIFDRFCIGK